MMRNKTIGPNLTAVFLCCREAFRYMEKQSTGGRIINLGFVLDQGRLGPRPQALPGLQARHDGLLQEHPARGRA